MICPLCGQTQTVGLVYTSRIPTVYYVCVIDGWRLIADPTERDAALLLFNEGEAFNEVTTLEKLFFSIKTYFFPIQTTTTTTPPQ